MSKNSKTVVCGREASTTACVDAGNIYSILDDFFLFATPSEYMDVYTDLLGVYLERTFRQVTCPDVTHVCDVVFTTQQIQLLIQRLYEQWDHNRNAADQDE